MCVWVPAEPFNISFSQHYFQGPSKINVDVGAEMGAASMNTIKTNTDHSKTNQEIDDAHDTIKYVSSQLQFFLR